VALRGATETLPVHNFGCVIDVSVCLDMPMSHTTPSTGADKALSIKMEGMARFLGEMTLLRPKTGLT
jgi:hypothetical protein